MLKADSSAERKPSDDHSSATPPIRPISAAFDSRLRTKPTRSRALVPGQDVAEVAQQRRRSPRAPMGLDERGGQEDERGQREQRVVGEHRGEMRAAGAEVLACDDRGHAPGRIRPPISARPIQALKRAERRQARARPRGRGRRAIQTSARRAVFRLGVAVLVVPSGVPWSEKGAMDGHEALADLKQISVQIEAAVVADHRCGPGLLAGRRGHGRAARAARAGDLGGGRRLASRPRSRRARAGRALDAAGQRVRRARPARRAARDDGADPTVGLVFYDLKSALHALDGQPGRAEPTVVWQADAGASAGGRRWRGVGAGARRRDARARLGRGLRADLQAQARAQREPRRPLLRGRLHALAVEGAPEADRMLPLAAEALAAAGR